MRQAEIKNAWDHWDRLYADIIRPKKLLENFRVVYASYSPHREEEAFVVCPWKPGPFRFIRHSTQPGSPPNFQKSNEAPVTSLYNRQTRKVTNKGVSGPRVNAGLTPGYSRSAQLCNRETPSPPIMMQRPVSSLAEQ